MGNTVACASPVDTELQAQVDCLNWDLIPASQMLALGIAVLDRPVGAERDVFKYYCPICMLYFKEIYKSSCCGHYICFSCVNLLQHKAGRNYSVAMDCRLLTSCPLCRSDGVLLNHVVNETPRSYEDSPRARDLLLSVQLRECAPELENNEQHISIARTMADVS